MTACFSAQRVAIIGLGLIGGSLARALRAHAAVDELVGCVETHADVALARELGLADTLTTNVAAAVAGADVVVLAVGVDTMGAVCAQLRDALPADTIVTDVGSTKASVVAAAQAQLDADAMTRFVPAHPIAGTENSGLRASVDELFRHRRTIVTPLPGTDAAALARVEQMWRSVGASVTTMTPGHHDDVLAATSHLPHLLAFSLVDTLAEMNERSEIFAYAAGGFADFTRIASSNPALWTGIMRANSDAVVMALDRHMQTLQTLRQALQDQDDDTIARSFTRAQQARDRFAGRDGPDMET